MKTKAAFIVRYPDNNLLGESVKVVTEGILIKDIKDNFKTTFPESDYKAKHMDEIAEDAMKRLNGASITEDQYKANLHECAVIVYTYEHTSILEFGDMLRIVQQVNNARPAKDNKANQ